MDSYGNTLASFDDETTARATLHSIVRAEPDAADYVALVSFDDDGMAVGKAKSVFEVEPAVTVTTTEFVIVRETGALIPRVAKGQRHYAPGVPLGFRLREPA
jgi:hypothetical protein